MTKQKDADRAPRLMAFSPIGHVRSSYQRRFGTPQQATSVEAETDAVLELNPTVIPASALVDLQGFERLWVLSWLDRGDTWAPTVMPPRGERKRRSLFATRSPDRPNPIGLSAVRLIRVDGCSIYVQGIDLLDATPILDIKPYVPYADAFPDAKAGWIDSVSREMGQIVRYEPGSKARAAPKRNL